MRFHFVQTAQHVVLAFALGPPHYLCFFTSKGSLHHYPGLLPTIGSLTCMIVAAQPAGSAPAGIASLMEPATGFSPELLLV
jgi:hypothetical protein